ncbi:hypothetical protein GQ457_06G012760 [Hibiscus cannabinus]
MIMDSFDMFWFISESFGKLEFCNYMKVVKPSEKVFQFELKVSETSDHGSEIFRRDQSASFKNVFKSSILDQNLQDKIEGLPEVELS